MSAKAKKIISINLVESNPIEKRLGEYLRLQRDVSGVEIKDLIMAAVRSYYDPLAIAADPNSSSAAIEAALIDSVLDLTHQRNRLISILESHGVNLRADCKSLLGVGDFSSVPNPLLQKQAPLAIDVEVEDEEDDFVTNEFSFV
jgi:hypothetical protein